jgi:hypothetical protein
MRKTNFIGRSFIMNKKSVYFCFGVLLICLVIGGHACKNNSGAQADVAGALLEVEGCKQWNNAVEPGTEQPKNQDCLEYRYIGQKLELKHINAAFNCCPGAVTADFNVCDKVVTITEMEETQGCFCVCLFDLEMEVDHLEPGEYTIRINEPYIENGDEPLEFTVQLSEGISGSYCLERNHYPWID